MKVILEFDKNDQAWITEALENVMNGKVDVTLGIGAEKGPKVKVVDSKEEKPKEPEIEKPKEPEIENVVRVKGIRESARNRLLLVAQKYGTDEAKKMLEAEGYKTISELPGKVSVIQAFIDSLDAEMRRRESK